MNEDEMTAEVLAAFLLVSPLGLERHCQVDDCLRRLRARMEIQLASVEAPAIAGHWTEGPGLTGRELYLFEDGTYISTEWGCILPEIIQDKGHWNLDASVLDLEPDSDVTWASQRGSNRRYAVLSMGGTMRLFGLDWSLEAFEELAVDEPKQWIEVLSLSQAKRWKGSQGRPTRARLLKTAWRPSFYESAEAAER